MKRLISVVHRHQHAAEDTSQRHSAERTENHFLFSPTSPATQINTSDSPFSPSFLGCRAEGVDAEPTTPSTTSLPLSSYRQGLPAPVATIALLRAAQDDHHASKSWGAFHRTAAFSSGSYTRYFSCTVCHTRKRGQSG